MKLTILGSGSPEPHVRRVSSGYLIEAAGQRLLFDCGGGVFDRLLHAGFLPSDLDALVFSHLHSDHMMDYARLIHARWDMKAADIPVYGPAPIKEITARLFGPSGAFAFDLAARTEFKGSQQVWLDRGGTLPRAWPRPEITEIRRNWTGELGGIRIEAFEVPHAQPWLTCLGFRVEAEGKSFVYSGDAGLCKSLESAAAGADLLLHWCYRNDGETLHPEIDPLAPTPQEIAAVAERAGVKHLILTHFRAQMDSEAGHKTARDGMATRFNGVADIAEDLQSFVI